MHSLSSGVDNIGGIGTGRNGGTLTGGENGDVRSGPGTRPHDRGFETQIATITAPTTTPPAIAIAVLPSESKYIAGFEFEYENVVIPPANPVGSDSTYRPVPLS